MNPTLPDLAVEFGEAADKAFAALGAVDCARRAEAQPEVRSTEVAVAMAELGVADVAPRTGLDAAAAGAELCRVAGRYAVPYPVAAVLMSTPGTNIPMAVAEPGRWRVDHGDLFDGWLLTDVDGRACAAHPASAPLGSKLGPFVTSLTPGAPGLAPSLLDASLWMTLSAWRVLGTAERCLELAVEHVTDRVQFGQHLADFQAVQFQLADAAVAVDGLRELSRFTLWRLFSDPATARADALALRLGALDAARAVIRTSQQLHGAAGLCDEYDVSVLARHIQPELRLPFGAERTATEMFAAVKREGFEALFPHGGGRG